MLKSFAAKFFIETVIHFLRFFDKEKVLVNLFFETKVFGNIINVFVIFQQKH